MDTFMVRYTTSTQFACRAVPGHMVYGAPWSASSDTAIRRNGFGDLVLKPPQAFAQTRT
jgi:hypothetical protein